MGNVVDQDCLLLFCSFFAKLAEQMKVQMSQYRRTFEVSIDCTRLLVRDR